MTVWNLYPYFFSQYLKATVIYPSQISLLILEAGEATLWGLIAPKICHSNHSLVHKKQKNDHFQLKLILVAPSTRLEVAREKATLMQPHRSE